MIYCGVIGENAFLGFEVPKYIYDLLNKEEKEVRKKSLFSQISNRRARRLSMMSPTLPPPPPS